MEKTEASREGIILNNINEIRKRINIDDLMLNINKRGDRYKFGQHTVMKKYFKDIWGLEPTIGFRDKKYYYLRFKKEDTQRLIKIIKPFIPNSMRYKIGEKNE